jgi:hypothetical protein
MRFARVKINAALILSLMRCRLAACGTWNPRDAIEYAQHNSLAHDAVINVYD